MVAVPPIAAVLIALLALLLCFAIVTFAKALAKIIPSGIPYVSHALRSTMIEVAQGAEQDIRWLLDDVLHPAADFILRLMAVPVNLLNGLYSTAVALARRVLHIAEVDIPNAIHSAERWSAGEINKVSGELVTEINAVSAFAEVVYKDVEHDLGVGLTAVEHYALSEVNALRSAVSKVIGDAITETNKLFAEATAFTDSVYHTLSGAIAADVAAAEGIAAAGLHAAEAETTRLFHDAEQFAQSTAIAAVGVLATDIDHAASAAIGAIWPDIEAGVSGLEGVIGTDFPDILSGLKGLASDVPTDLLGALSFAGALSIPMLRYMERCGVPNCRNLSQFGRDLQALLGLVGGVGFLALVIDLIENPVGAAHEVEDVIGGIVDGTLTVARDMLGV